jgi:thiol-disulfide isomerase/thioredoxin
MKLLLYCLLAMLWPAGLTHAQKATTNIRPLTIGDTLPADLVIENVVNYPASKIRLSDLKGKLVILDFWGRYCSSCIKAFPAMDSLQTAFKDKIQIITLSDFKDSVTLRQTLAKYPVTRNLQLPTSLQNETFAAYFPHQTVSHVIWINPEGVITGITGSDYVTKDHIAELLAHKKVNWPVKNDLLSFDYQKPLLGLAQPELSQPSILYYSTFTGYLDGIAPPNGIIRDSASLTIITSYYNAPLLTLCKIALGFPAAEKIEWKVKNMARYNWTKEIPYSDWQRTNSYCYSITLPSSINDAGVKSIVKADLLRWLSIIGVEVKTKTKTVQGKKLTNYIISDL